MRSTTSTTTRISALLLGTMLGLMAGCGEDPATASKKEILTLEQVPESIRKLATKELPDVTFERALRKPDGTYEVIGKEKSGKVREVEVQPDGKVVEIE